MVFDKALVEAVLGDNRGLAAEIASGFDEYVCVLGAGDLEVSFLHPNTAFRIEEYDGSESIQEFSHMEFYHA